MSSPIKGEQFTSLNETTSNHGVVSTLFIYNTSAKKAFFCTKQKLDNKVIIVYNNYSVPNKLILNQGGCND